MTFIADRMRGRVDALLQTIVSAYRVNPDGGLSTSDMSIKLYKQSLFQLLRVEKSKITAVEFEQCAYRALIATIKSRSEKSEAYEANITAEIARYKRIKPKEYRVCSRCYSMFPGSFSFEMSLWDAKARITSHAPSYLNSDQPVMKDGKVALSTPETGAYLSLSVRSRSVSGALDQSTNDIALLLGVLNFGLNHGTLSWSWFGSNNDVRAKVFPGRDVFVIGADGKANAENWRYYTVLPNESKWLPKKDLDKFSNVERLISILEKRSPKDRQFYREFFTLYFDALSEKDDDSIVMRLWKAAEHITCSQSADQMAERLSLTWDDKEVVSAVCFSLGHRRNSVIHSPRPLVSVGDMTQLFRHFLEFSVWKSLSPDVKGVDHWKVIMKMSDLKLDLNLAEKTVSILKALR